GSARSARCRRGGGMTKGRWALVAVGASLVLIAAACGGSASPGGSPAAQSKPSGCPKGTHLPDKVCAGEGELDLIAWVGYTEDGSTDPNFDWVHPFQDQTGCIVHV